MKNPLAASKHLPRKLLKILDFRDSPLRVVFPRRGFWWFASRLPPIRPPRLGTVLERLTGSIYSELGRKVSIVFLGGLDRGMTQLRLRHMHRLPAFRNHDPDLPPEVLGLDVRILLRKPAFQIFKNSVVSASSVV